MPGIIKFYDLVINKICYSKFPRSLFIILMMMVVNF